MERINAECANVGEFDCRHYGAHVNGRFLGNWINKEHEKSIGCGANAAQLRKQESLLLGVLQIIDALTSINVGLVEAPNYKLLIGLQCYEFSAERVSK